MTSRVLVDYVCDRRKGSPHRLATAEADPSGTLMLRVAHVAVADKGKHPGEFRERPGEAATGRLDDLPAVLLIACACGRPTRFYAHRVREDVAGQRRRVVLSATGVDVR